MRCPFSFILLLQNRFWAYNPTEAVHNKVRPYGLTFLFYGRNTMNRACTNDGCACTPNASIKCTVSNCAHHCKDVDNCGLTAIQVGTHESHPTMDQCTDCQSYQKCQ